MHKRFHVNKTIFTQGARKGLILTAMVPLLAGCAVTNLSELEFWIEPGVVQEQDRMWVRYSDGQTVSEGELIGHLGVNDLGQSKTYEAYKAQTDSGKTVVGMFVTDGRVSWVPAFHYTQRGVLDKQIAVSRDDWGKPTVKAEQVSLVGFGNDATLYGAYSLVLKVSDAEGRAVDGQTEIFARSSDPGVRFINAAAGDIRTKLYVQSVATYNGIAEFKLIAAEPGGSLKEEQVLSALSFASGNRSLTVGDGKAVAGVDGPQSGVFRLLQGQTPLRLTAHELANGSVTSDATAGTGTVGGSVYGRDTWSVTDSVYSGLTGSSLAYASSQSPNIVRTEVSEDGTLLLYPVNKGVTTVSGAVYLFGTVTSDVYKLAISEYRPFALPVQVTGSVLSGDSKKSVEMGQLYGSAGTPPVPGWSGQGEVPVSVWYKDNFGEGNATPDNESFITALDHLQPGRSSLVFAIPEGSGDSAVLTLTASQMDLIKNVREKGVLIETLIVHYRQTAAIVPLGMLFRVPAGAEMTIHVQQQRIDGAGRTEGILLTPDHKGVSYFGRNGISVTTDGAAASVRLNEPAKGTQTP